MKKPVDPSTFGGWLDTKMEEQDLSLEDMASKTGLSVGKIHRARRNISCTHETRLAIEGSLNDAFREEEHQKTDDIFGGYRERDVWFLCGTFVSYRWGYELTDKIIRSVVQIAWSKDTSVARATEYNLDSKKLKPFGPSQTATLYFSEATRMATLLTVWKGSVRVSARVAVPPNVDDASSSLVLFGGVDSQANPDGRGFRPVTSPLALVRQPMAPTKQKILELIEPVDQQDTDYKQAREWLQMAAARGYSAWR